MTRLLAYRGNEPERLRIALSSLRATLFPDVSDEDLLTEGNADKQPSGPKTRWGLGYYIGGEPHVQRFAGMPLHGFTGLRALRSDVALLQRGDADAHNVPPYRYGRLLLSMQGTVPAPSLPPGSLSTVAPLVPETSLELPAFLRRNLRDGSAGELLLHRFCARLYEADPEYLKDPRLPVEVALAVLSAVVPTIRGAGQLQVAVSNGDWLIVARRGSQPIFYRALNGVTEVEQRFENYRGLFAIADPLLSPDAARAAGLTELSSDHALVVLPDLAVRAQPLT